MSRLLYRPGVHGAMPVAQNDEGPPAHRRALRGRVHVPGCGCALAQHDCDGRLGPVPHSARPGATIPVASSPVEFPGHRHRYASREGCNLENSWPPPRVRLDEDYAAPPPGSGQGGFVADCANGAPGSGSRAADPRPAGRRSDAGLTRSGMPEDPRVLHWGWRDLVKPAGRSGGTILQVAVATTRPSAAECRS